MAAILLYMQEHSLSGTTSSAKGPHSVEHGTVFHTNVEPERLEKILGWWANTALDKFRVDTERYLRDAKFREEIAESDLRYLRDEGEKLVAKFPDMFWSERMFHSTHLSAPEGTYNLSPTRLHESYVYRVASFGRRLREVWDDDVRRPKRMAFLHYWILELFINPQSGWTPHAYIESGLFPDDSLDILLKFLGNNSHRLRHCPNPSCKRPYFLASKGNTKYCSESCANYGRKQTQRHYWNAGGADKRRERIEKIRKAPLKGGKAPKRTRRAR